MLCLNVDICFVSALHSVKCALSRHHWMDYVTNRWQIHGCPAILPLTFHVAMVTMLPPLFLLLLLFV